MASAAPPRIVLCVGTDAWLRQEAVRACLAQVVAPGAQALDQQTMPAEPWDLQTLTAALQTLPMMSPRRFVVLDGLLPSEGLGWLAEYATAPVPSACLIVSLEDSPSAALRAALASGGPGAVREISCQPLTGGALVAWIRQRVAQAGQKSITPEAAHTLVARAGADLAGLAHLVDQLALYVGERTSVTGQDVTALIGWSVEERTFAIVDAALARDRATALRITHQLLEEHGVAPEEVLGVLGWHLRRLWKRSPRAAAGALDALVETDRLLKTGTANSTALVERCVWELAGGRPQAAAVS